MARDWEELEAWRRREKVTPGMLRNLLAWADLNHMATSRYNDHMVVLWQATNGRRVRDDRRPKGKAPPSDD